MVDNVDDTIALIDILYCDLSHPALFILQHNMFPFHHGPELAAGNSRQFRSAIPLFDKTRQFF